MSVAADRVILKSTRVERWLATHVPYFAHRWMQRIRAARQEEARQALESARADLCFAAHRYVACLGWASEHPEEVEWRRATLVTMACRERNALLLYIELTGGCEARDVAVKLMQDTDEPPPPASMTVEQ